MAGEIWQNQQNVCLDIFRSGYFDARCGQIFFGSKRLKNYEKNTLSNVNYRSREFVSLVVFFADESTTVKGYVRDDGGKPVADVEISFGGVGGESKTKTDAKGYYTVTVKHRLTQMLYLTAKKEGVGLYSDKFPGFAAPDGDKNIELIPSLGTIPKAR